MLKLMGMTQQFYITIIFACCTQRYKSMSISCMVQEILSHKINNAYRTMNMVYFSVSQLQMIGGGKSVVLCGPVLLFFCSFVPCLHMHNCASE